MAAAVRRARNFVTRVGHCKILAMHSADGAPAHAHNQPRASFRTHLELTELMGNDYLMVFFFALLKGLRPPHPEPQPKPYPGNPPKHLTQTPALDPTLNQDLP